MFDDLFGYLLWILYFVCFDVKYLQENIFLIKSTYKQIFVKYFTFEILVKHFSFAH